MILPTSNNIITLITSLHQIAIPSKPKYQVSIFIPKRTDIKTPNDKYGPSARTLPSPETFIRIT